MSEPWKKETALVNTLGLNRDELRALRKKMLREGEDWRHDPDGIKISPAAVHKLRTHLKAPTPSPAAVQTTGRITDPSRLLPQKSGEPVPAEDVTFQLCVFRTFPKNRHIIEGYHVGKDPARRGNIVRIKVKDSSRYTRFDNTGAALVLECRWIQADFYEHVGALPKRRGRR